MLRTVDALFLTSCSMAMIAASRPAANTQAPLLPFGLIVLLELLWFAPAIHGCSAPLY
jgi:hypothetical protein